MNTAGGGGAAAQVLELCHRAETACTGTPLANRARAARERLEGPLRIAIAGRVKAGKSTLLNALVGERLAPTDAGECTRIVTWYHHAPGYEVVAKLRNGESRPIGFDRADGSLDIDLGPLTIEEVDQLVVGWPASALTSVTLIDTPGLASINDENSVRTQTFLDNASGRPAEADAVVYLMRHLHRRDVEFLDAFMDRSVPGASPVNAVAVLSRADEIGAGRLDALDSAQRIAARYRADPNVQGLCSTVVPLAGLLAETGLTLREDEAAALRTLATTEASELERMLLSADTFCEISASGLTVEIRQALLDRLGLYGVRFALDEIASGRATTAVALAQRLVERSGLTELRRLLDEHFLPRARVLQARSALVAVRALVNDLRAVNPVAADAIEREGERIEAGASEFAQLRTAHLVLSGSVTVSPAERVEIERLLMAPSGPAALGLTPEDPAETVRKVALEGIERWRTRGSDPLADPALVEVCETVSRTYESLFATT